MAPKDKLRVVLDTNVLVSALVYGGVPQKVVEAVVNGRIVAVASKWLILELVEILVKKFRFSREYREMVEQLIIESWMIVMPEVTISVLRDDPDNRVLEAAVTGNCQYIVTGDKELLALGMYQTIRILSPSEFLREMK